MSGESRPFTASLLGPFLLGAIFAALGGVLLAVGDCQGYWAFGFALIVFGVAAKLWSLARQPEISWKGDRVGWVFLIALTIPGIALFVVGGAAPAGAC